MWKSDSNILYTFVFERASTYENWSKFEIPWLGVVGFVLFDLCADVHDEQMYWLLSLHCCYIPKTNLNYYWNIGQIFLHVPKLSFNLAPHDILFTAAVSSQICVLITYFRVFCWPRLPCLVLSWENHSFWSQRTCCEAMHCVSASSYCFSCGCFSSGWLLAPLARCIYWRSYRFVNFNRF